MPGDTTVLRAENARLREAVERLRLLGEDKDRVIADLRARKRGAGGAGGSAGAADLRQQRQLLDAAQQR